MDLNGSHIVITGASKGLGAGLARELSSRGARLTLIARPSEELTAVATETGRYRVQGNLTFHGVTREVEGEITLSAPDDRTL